MEVTTSICTATARGSHLPILLLGNPIWNESPDLSKAHSPSQGESWLTAWIFGKSRDIPPLPEKHFSKSNFMDDFPLGKTEFISLSCKAEKHHVASLDCTSVINQIKLTPSLEPS